MCFDYISEDLKVSRFYSHFIASTKVTTYNSDHLASDMFHWYPWLTSRIVLEPDSFERICDYRSCFKLLRFFPNLTIHRKSRFQPKSKMPFRHSALLLEPAVSWLSLGPLVFRSSLSYLLETYKVETVNFIKLYNSFSPIFYYWSSVFSVFGLLLRIGLCSQYSPCY